MVLTASMKQRIRDLATQFGVSEVRLFGSTARGTARLDSDVDLLVRFERGASLITVIGFQQAVEEALGARVDVVEEAGLSPRLATRILAEAVNL
ncbi:MAG: nucleotidyltransferase family protein [Fimbriimonadaceae bacterium]|nr:nucleotidyltransferase family protein [Fimbriimonadaceae bacterium]